MPNARAASGTWGEQNTPYLDGVVCQVLTSSVPLVSWTFKSGNSPGFLLDTINSTGGHDSGEPPTGSRAQITSSDTASNMVGGTQNAAALAYLITHYGSGNSAKVGEVAELVAESVGGKTAPACLLTGQGGMSRTDADAIWRASQQLAGPYALKVTGAPKAGSDSTVSAQVNVTSAAGQPVPGMTVTLSAPGTSNATMQARTGSDGVANFTVKAPSVVNVNLTATVSAVTTLNVISAAGSVSGVAAAAPTIASATATVPVNAQAAPTITASWSSAGTTLSAVVHSTIKIGGMHGHSSSIASFVNGPLPLGANAACPTTDSFATAPIVAQSTVNVTGDASVPGPDLAPTAAGCYALSATVTTNDSNQNVTARTGSVAVLAALPTTIAMTLPNNGLVGPGKAQLTAVVTSSLGLPGQLTGTVYGPLPINNGVCTGMTWSGAPVLGALSVLNIQGDGSFALQTPELPQAGCYAASLRAKIGPLPIDLPVASGTSTWTVLAPTISVSQDSTWVPLGVAISSTVTLGGTWSQKGHLALTLYQTPEPATGCLSVDWSKATKLMIGNDVPFTGDGVYTVKSALIAKAGCYSVVPTATLDANRLISVVGTVGDPASIVQAAASIVQNPTPEDTIATTTPLQIFLLTGGIFATMVLAAAAGTVALARRQAWPMGAL